MNRFNLRPAAEAIGIALCVEGLVVLVCFVVVVVVWGPVLARLM